LARSKLRVEEDCVWALRLHERKQLGRGVKRLDPFEHVAQREARGQRDVGVIVDHHG
jgi:hypothetical protein